MANRLSVYSGLMDSAFGQCLMQHASQLEPGGWCDWGLNILFSKISLAMKSEHSISWPPTWTVYYQQLRSKQDWSSFADVFANPLSLTKFDMYWFKHYNDVTMSILASQITSVWFVCLAVYSVVYKKTSKLHVTGLCEGNPPVTKGH